MDSIRQSITDLTHRLSSFSALERPTPDFPVIFPAALNLAANDLGSDYIIGAPHGNIGLFQQIVCLLRPHDRLFVCGNIVNRHPHSKELIKYIEEQWSADMQIYLIRGNHENMVLKALENWDAVAESESEISSVFMLNPNDRMIEKKDMEEKVLYLQKINNDRLNAYLLIDEERLIWSMPINNNTPLPEAGARINHQKIIKHLMSTYGYTAKTVSTIQHWIQRGNNFPYPKQAKEELYKALFHACSGKKNFFAHCSFELYNLILNGGAWVIDLSNIERKQIINFIQPLPYFIRVCDQFDCVCAAPPEESVIQRLLSGEQPSLNEINYMTWAKINSGDTLMLPNSRTQDSLRAYTAHNPLYGNTQSIQTYHNWNIIVLNAGTFLSQALLIVNHSSKLGFYMAGETKPKNEINTLQEVANMIQAYLRHDLNRLTSTTTLLLNWEQAHRANNKEPTLNDSCLALETNQKPSLSHDQFIDLLESQFSPDKGKINWRFYRDTSTEESDEEEAEGNHRPTLNSSTQAPI